MKGKPWSVEEEQKLTDLVKRGFRIPEISSILGKSYAAVQNKMRRLGLVEGEIVNFNLSPSSIQNKLSQRPDGELRSAEETLQLLNSALDVLRNSGLDKTEILRLRTVIQGARVYLDLLAEFINYEVIERKLVELEANYAKLLRKKAKNVEANQDSSFVV